MEIISQHQNTETNYNIIIKRTMEAVSYFTYLLHGATVLVELATSHIPLHFLLSAVLNLHLLIHIFLRSSSTLSICLIRGFPLSLLVLTQVFLLKPFLGSLCSSILKTCPSHLNRKVLITVAKSIFS
jgi:ABC-type amino acid transport system permease subunit